MIGKLLSDIVGVAKVSGIGRAIQWAVCVALTLPANLRSKNLLAADRLMGEGPFRVRHDGTSALLVGESSFSGLREIWVRDVYARENFLEIPDNGTVLDLGSNRGIFSVMAMTANKTARLVAVEPNADFAPIWHSNMEVNKIGDRASLCRAFLGNFTAKQTNDHASKSGYQDAPLLPESRFLELYDIKHIDFLKCDIEGSEYYMLEPESKILAIADRVAIELHDVDLKPQAFLDRLRILGFDKLSVDWYGNECIARAARSVSVKGKY